MNGEFVAEVRRLQSESDRKSAAWLTGYRLLGGEIFCSRGCSNCCSLAVHCSWPESLCAAEAVPGECSARLASHVTGLRAIAVQSSDFTSFLKLHRQQIGFCPFLAENSCSIYHDRPLSCRALLSTKESHWCGADFGALTSEEKNAFMATLDRDVVAFPTQYVAATREVGQDLEHELSRFMGQNLGFSMYGNLPLMVYLNREYGFTEIVSSGYDETTAFLDSEGLNHPWLATLCRHSPNQHKGV